MSPNIHQAEGDTSDGFLQNELVQFRDRIFVIEPCDTVRQIQTLLRDKNTGRTDFVFNADRLIRLVIEEGLDQLPQDPLTVYPPTGTPFNGVQFIKGNCGVSVIRSGEAMERGLRDCCRSIRIGKILIQTAEEDGMRDARVLYAKLPPGIENRRILLMYPCLNDSAIISAAVDVLLSYGVLPENIILLTLFACPNILSSILSKITKLRIVTSEIHSIPFNHFGTKYFGTY